MEKDIWHFPRMTLADQVMSLFNGGLSSALTFFAPRRMGKTEFLIKDIMPAAKRDGWDVFYYSFLDSEDYAQEKFISALLKLAMTTGAVKPVKRNLKKMSASAMGLGYAVEFDNETIESNAIDLVSLIHTMAKKQKMLMLLDEVQALAFQDKNQVFLASLRTALDTNKDHVKVIFTGSSREGLRKMFSSARAPFFHFGQNLNFPSLERPFISHLCNVYKLATQKELDEMTMWDIFVDFEYSPQLIRSLIERVALNPGLGLEDVKAGVLHDLHHDRNFNDIWLSRSQLERLILIKLAHNESSLYSQAVINDMANSLGIEGLKAFTIQSALKALIRADLVIQSSAQLYIIEDPNFANWIRHVD